MDVKAYIESGIIESYVLGLATEKESDELLSIAAAHPEVQHEIIANQKALENYISLYHTTPSAITKDKLFEFINADKETVNIDMKEAGVVSPIRVWWVAASFILLASSLLYNVFLMQSVRSKDAQIAQLHSHQQKLVLDNLINKANYRNASEQLALIHKHGNKTTHLEGLNISKESSAMIYWNSETKDLFVAIDFLPKPPEGKQYQLWALADGKPIDAGVIDLYATEKSLLKMKNIEKAQAFAISLEKLGGVPSPTMEAIFAMGSI